MGLSIKKYMTGPMVARLIRMERQSDKTKSIVLLEGTTDIKRFKSYLNEESCILLNCWGREKILVAVESLTQKPPAGLAAFVDADFDRLRNRLSKDKRVLYSETHDFDLDWVQTEVLDEYLEQVGDSDKVAAMGGAKAIFDAICQGLRPISAARLLNVTRHHSFKVSNINAADHFKGFSVDLDTYLSELAPKSDAIEIGKLKTLIEKTANDNHDLLQFTNGHDFYCALGASLRDQLGDRKEAQTYGSECEIHLRLTFTQDRFKLTSLYAQILGWQANNKPYLLVKTT